MNIITKKELKKHIINALLLAFVHVSSANAASFSDQESFEDERLIPDAEMFSTEAQPLKQDQVEKNYHLMLKLIKQKNYAQANKTIKGFIKENPNEAVYHNLRALLQITAKDLIGAEKSFLKVIELKPKNVQALMRLSTLALNKENFDQAKQYANKALENSPYEVVAYQVLADVAMQQQGIEAAEAIFLNAQSMFKGRFQSELEILKSLGKLYFIKKQPEKLLALAQELNGRYQQVPAALFLVEAQLANGDDIGAEQTLRQIIIKAPNEGMPQFILAKLLDKKEGKTSEVLDLLDKAALNLHNPVAVLAYKTGILIRQKKYQQALAVAKQVDQSNSEQGAGKKLIADVYLAEEKYPQALEQYQLAYKKNPNINNLDGVLKILTLQNKHNDVIALLNEELIKHKEETALQFRLAVAYQNANQNKLSIKYYQTVLSKQQNNVIALNNLAWIYSHEHNPKAVIVAKQAYEIAPKSSIVADTYGFMLLEQGDYQESIKVLKQGLALDRDSPILKLHLAEAYLADKKISDALELLRDLANEKSPVTTRAKQLLKQYL